MRKLSVFNHLSLDGFFTDATGDMSWAHTGSDDAEWNAFVAENATGGGPLMFGRVTYQMMAGFWPTPMAAAMNPVVADRMNAMPKIVFSRTLHEAAWSNTTLLGADMLSEVRRLKSDPGDDITILGSGTVVSALTEAGLIDEYQLVVNPIVLGSGRTLFENVTRKLRLRRTGSRSFGNGSVLVSYAPME